MEKLVLILTFTFILSITYDKIIYGDETILFKENPSTKEITYLLQRNVNNLIVQINNFYGDVYIMQDERIIYHLQKEENSVEFNFSQSYKYYIRYIYPSPFEICGLKVLFSQNEFNTISSKNNIYVYYLKKKNANPIIIKNEKTGLQLISIKISSSNYNPVYDCFFEENGKKIDIQYKRSTFSYTYYTAFLSNTLLFTPYLISKSSGLDTINYAIFSLEYHTINIISSTQLIYKDSYNGNFGYYIIKNTNYSYFEISMSENSKLYLYMDNDFEIMQIRNPITFSTKYEPGFIFDVLEQSGSIFVNFMNSEKIIVSQEKTLNITLLNTRLYELTIINTSENRTTFISLRKNNYFELRAINLPNDNKTIKCEDDSKSNYYICSFYQYKNETEVDLYFYKIITNFYKSYEANINIYFKTINKSEKEKKKKKIVNISYTISIILLCICLLSFVCLLCYKGEYLFTDWGDNFLKVYLCKKRKI